jgi:hypothetical protein
MTGSSSLFESGDGSFENNFDDADGEMFPFLFWKCCLKFTPTRWGIAIVREQEGANADVSVLWIHMHPKATTDNSNNRVIILIFVYVTITIPFASTTVCTVVVVVVVVEGSEFSSGAFNHSISQPAGRLFGVWTSSWSSDFQIILFEFDAEIALIFFTDVACVTLTIHVGLGRLTDDIKFK